MKNYSITNSKITKFFTTMALLTVVAAIASVLAPSGMGLPAGLIAAFAVWLATRGIQIESRTAHRANI